MAVKIERLNKVTWRFSEDPDTKLEVAAEAYRNVDQLMREEGYVPIRTRFVSNDDGTFWLEETYANR
jgi:hypothetical protein